MVTPELRLLRYFIAVADTGNVTRAAELLHISQPSLSAAVKRLESQLDVELLTRQGRSVTITPAGELLAREGRQLLEQADHLAERIRAHASASPARLRVGMSPTARYGAGPTFLAACAERAPAIMIYTSEDTTGALLRDVAAGRLDMAVTFCAPAAPPRGVELLPLSDEPAVVHLAESHPLAGRPRLSLRDLADETILVASSGQSAGFTDRILAAFAEAGVSVRTAPDPYPDLGLQAVREQLGVVIYVRDAFPERLAGSVFIPLEPELSLPFHLALRTGAKNAALAAIRPIVDQLSEPDGVDSS